MLSGVEVWEQVSWPVFWRESTVMKESEEDDGTSTIIEYGTSTSDSQPETNLTALLVSEQMVPIQQPGVVHIQESKWNYKWSEIELAT